jgi:hypothetical protein
MSGRIKYVRAVPPRDASGLSAMSLGANALPTQRGTVT